MPVRSYRERERDGERERERERLRGFRDDERNGTKSAGDLLLGVIEWKKSNQTHRITALCSVFSPSRWTSWMGPSGRRASVLETCIEVNIAA